MGVTSGEASVTLGGVSLNLTLSETYTSIEFLLGSVVGLLTLNNPSISSAVASINPGSISMLLTLNNPSISSAVASINPGSISMLLTLNTVTTSQSPSNAHKVEWPMTSTGLTLYNATDGNTTTTTGYYNSTGLNLANGNAYFTATNGNNISDSGFTIGFSFKKEPGEQPGDNTWILSHYNGGTDYPFIFYRAGQNTHFYVYTRWWDIIQTN